MKTNFYIRRKDKDGFYSIELHCADKGIRVVWNTKIKVAEKDWNKNKQQTKNPETNEKLAAMAKYALAYNGRVLNSANFGNYMTNEFLTPRPADESKITLQNLAELETFKIVQKLLLDAELDKFISNIHNRTNQNGEIITEGRIANYKRLVADIKKFEHKQSGKLAVQDMDGTMVSKFLDWLRLERQLAPNTLKSRMKMVRAMLAVICKENKIELDYKAAKVVGEQVEHIVLSDKEAEAMMNLDVSFSRRLQNVQKLFIVGICTGLRFSDYSNVKLQHIDKEKNVLTIHQKKTGARVEIPIHPKLQQIIDNGEMPHPISLQSYNQYLRELARLAGITTKVEIKTVTGGKRKIKIVPKWQLVTSHICRRSFASRLYRRGVNPQIIMRLTGHSQLSTFMNYIVISNEDIFESVKNIW